MTSREKLRPRPYKEPNNYHGSMYPTVRSEESAISDLQYVWQSVDELKVGLERTEKKLEKIGKEPWNALSDIRAFAVAPQKTQIPNNSNITLRYKKTVDGNGVGTERPFPVKTSIEQKNLLLSSSEGVSYKKTGGSNGSLGSSSNASALETDQLAEFKEQVPIRYLNSPIPPSALVHHIQGTNTSSSPVDLLARAAISPDDLKRFAVGRHIVGSPVSRGSSPDLGEGESIAIGPSGEEDLPMEHKVVIRVSRSMEEASNPSLSSRNRSLRKSARSKSNRSQQTHSSSPGKEAGNEREVPARESASWPDVHRRDGLQKLREIVAKQQQELASSVSQPASAPNVRTLHYSEDVVVPKVDDEPLDSGYQQPQRIMVRKVAAAPPVPSYPGFSTSKPESTRRCPTSFEPVPEKKKKLDIERDGRNKVISTRRLKKSEWPPKVKKVAKITGDLQDYIICPSSWRKGQELILRELGHFKPDLGKEDRNKSSDTDENMSDEDQPTEPNTSSNNVPNIQTSTVMDSPKKTVDSTYRVTRDVAEKDGVIPVEEHADQSPKEGTTDSNDKSDSIPTRDIPDKGEPWKAMNAVSQESSVDENSQEAEKSSEQSPVKISAFKKVIPSSKHPQLQLNKKRKPSPAADAGKSQPKVRHYDAEAVRNYISKQRKERLQRQQEEKQRKQRQLQEKQKKLQELQQLQKKLAQSKAMKLAPSPSPHPDSERNTSSDPHQLRLPNAGDEEGISAHSNKPRHQRKNSASKEMDSQQRSTPAVFEDSDGQRRVALINSPVDRTTNNSEIGLSSTSSSLENERASPKNNVDSGNAGPSMSTTTFASSVSSSVDERETDIDKMSTESPTADILFPKKTALGALAASCQKEMSLMMAKLQPFLNARGREVALNGEFDKTKFGADSSDAAAKVERIEMLRATAESLQQRITEETARITHSCYIRSNSSHSFQRKIFDVRETSESDMPLPNTYYGMPISGQGEAPDSKSAFRQFEDYDTRNERIMRSKNQFSVFEGKLPGVTSLVKHAQMVAENQRRNSAATKIQSWFKGHRVRQMLKWKLPSGRSLGSRLTSGKAPVTDQKSLNSDISDRLSRRGSIEKPKHIDTLISEQEDNLLQTEFCAGERKTVRTTEYTSWNEFHSSIPRALLPIANSVPHKVDPYNFINTLHRKLQQRQAEVWIPLSPTKPASPKPDRPRSRELVRNSALVRHETSSPAYADDFESSMKSSHSKGPSRIVPVGAESHVEYRSISTISSFSEVESYSTKNVVKSLEEKKIGSLSHHSQDHESSGNAGSFKAPTTSDRPNSHPVSLGQEKRSEVGMARAFRDSKEEILSEGTLSEEVASFEAESVVTHLSSRAASPVLNKELSKPRVFEADKQAPLVTESSVTSSDSQSVLSVSGTHSTLKSKSLVVDLGPDTMFEGLQFSPSTLRLRMSTELNYLDSLEESLRQITTVERVQALALARQETVSLAQALQNEQQKKTLEAELANQASLRSAEEHQRTLAEAQKKHEEVLAAATRSINQVRSEAHSAINNTAHKLLESQAEAAKATAEAARQLAEANIATLGYPKSIDAQNVTKLVTATAASAAAAAVSTALKKLRRRASRLKSSTTHSPAASSSGDSASYLQESRTRSSRYRSSKSIENTRSEEKHTVPSSARSESDATIPEEISDHDHGTYVHASKQQALREQENASPPSVSTRSPASVPSTSRDTSPVGAEEQTMSEGSLPEIIEEEYSEKFEETVTEEEAEEQFYRKILPSESHRLQSLGKRRRPDGSFSDLKSQSSQDTAHSEAGEEHSSQLFSSEDSFNKFTMQMVHQYMKEEELRAKHQMALLELRDKSLVEKTKAEMAWLELQKQQLRDKGQDDKMPPLRKRQRGLMLRLEQEQAEIRRLREAHLVASQERQILLQQQQQIARLRHSTRQILGKIQKATPGAPLPSLKSLPINLTSASKSVDSSPKPIGSRRHHLSSSEAGASDEEMSVTVDGSKSEEVEEVLCTKSESEALSDIQSELMQLDMDEETAKSKSKANLQVMKGLKKMQSNRRNLTTREKRLLQRRKDVEQELQSWQKKLETEEQKIQAMEEETRRLQQKEEMQAEAPRSLQEQQVQVDWGDVLLDDKPADVDVDTIKEQIPKVDQSSSIKTQSVMTEEVASTVKTATETHTIPEDSKMLGSQAGNNTSEVDEELTSPDRRESEAGDIATEINKSSPETPPESKSVGSGDYSSSFESPTPAVSHQQKLSDSKSGVSGPSNERQSAPVSLTIRLPLSPRIHTHKRRDSSGSEDSFTVSQSGAETASDLSDIEGRIHALKEELRRRKVEAERLRKEQKRRSKERLKAQEASLLKQIEAYDCFIRQTKAELERELEVEMQPKVAVKPQIRQPKVAESRHLPHKLQSSIGSALPGAGGDSSADELGSPQANLSFSPRLTPREEPIGSPSEPLSASSSKKSSLGSIDENIEKSSSPFKDDEENAVSEGKKDLEAEDVKGESDNDDSTSDSVRTVTEVGDLPSQKTHSIGKVVPSSAEEEKVKDKSQKSQIDIFQGDVPVSLDKLQTKPADAATVSKEAISRQSTLSDVGEELSFQDDTKSEGFSPVLSLKDIEQEVVYSADLKHVSKREEESRTAQHGKVVEESAKSKRSLSERRQLFRQISSEDDTVAEEIEEEVVEEDNLLDDSSQPNEEEIGTKLTLSTQEAIDKEDSEESTFHASAKEAKQENLKSDKSEGIKPESYSKDNAKTARVEDVSNRLLTSLVQDSFTDIVEIKKKRCRKREEEQIVESRTAQGISPKSHMVEEEESAALPATVGDLLNQTFTVDEAEMPPQDLTSKQASKETLVLNKCLEELLSDSLKTMLSIYKKRDGIHGRKDSGLSWKASAVGQRIASILNVVDKNASPAKDTLLRPSILSLSSPTAYSDVFSSSEGSPSTPGSPTKDQLDRLSFRPSSPVLGEHTDDIQTPLDASGLPSTSDEGEGPLIQDLNPDQEWFEDDLGLGESQVTERDNEAGNYYQIYPYQEYYFIREIPNKPPPPYTPPNQLTGLDAVVVETETGFPGSHDEKVVKEPVSPAVVPSADKELPQLVEEAASVIQREVAGGCSADDVKPPREFLEIPRGEGERDRHDLLVAANGRSFRRFVFDLTKEMLSEAQTTAREPPRPPWMRPKWLSRCRGATLPRDPQACVSALQRRVTQLVAPASLSPVSATTASAVRLGRKKRDRVDEILVQELREEELDWVTYDEDEVTVKLQLADSIFDCLLSETGNLVAGMQQQRKFRRLKQKPVR